MHQFGVPNGRKAIKNNSSGFTGKFIIKKFKFYLRAVFFLKKKICIFFSSRQENNHLSYQDSVNDKPHLHSIDAK